MKTVKPFRQGGEDVAEIVRWQSVDGVEKIDVAGLTLSPREARRLSRWLVRAADSVAAYNYRFNWKRAKPLPAPRRGSPVAKITHQLEFPFAGGVQ